MTVKELIANLQECNPEAEVFVIDGPSMSDPLEVVNGVSKIPEGVVIY